MAESVRANFRWTVNELLAGTRAHYCARFPLALRIAYFVAGGLTFLVGLTQTIQYGSRAMMSMIVGLILLTQYTVIMPLTLRSQFKRRPDGDSDVTWEFSSGGIQSLSGGNKADSQWTAYEKIVRTKGGLLFYPTQTVFNWVPRHAFNDEAAFEQVSAWAAEFGRKFKRKS